MWVAPDLLNRTYTSQVRLTGPVIHIALREMIPDGIFCPDTGYLHNQHNCQHAAVRITGIQAF